MTNNQMKTVYDIEQLKRTTFTKNTNMATVLSVEFLLKRHSRLI